MRSAARSCAIWRRRAAPPPRFRYRGYAHRRARQASSPPKQRLGRLPQSEKPLSKASVLDFSIIARRRITLRRLAVDRIVRSTRSGGKIGRAVARSWARLARDALVGVTGFEPATSCSQSRCSTRLSYAPAGREPRPFTAAAQAVPPPSSMRIPCESGAPQGVESAPPAAAPAARGGSNSAKFAPFGAIFRNSGCQSRSVVQSETP